MKKGELSYINNLKVLLSILVVMFHTSSSLGGSGGWYYVENSSDEFSKIILTFFNAICQCFFMGLFFLISGYFVTKSFEKKGLILFIKDKLYRLLIPALFYYYILNAICINLVKPTPYFKSLGFYNLWFAMALLYFMIIYSFSRKFDIIKVRIMEFPGKINLLVYIITMGIINFIVRIYFPTNILSFSDFTIGYFPNYIVLFYFGIVCYKNDWFNKIEKNTVKVFMSVSIILIICLPLLLLLSSDTSNFNDFSGGITIESVLYSFWEPSVAIGIILTLIYLFKKYFDCTNSLLKLLSRCSYSVYIVQSPIIIVLQKLLLNTNINILIKFIIISALSYILSIILSNILIKISVIKSILA